MYNLLPAVDTAVRLWREDFTPGGVADYVGDVSIGRRARCCYHRYWFAGHDGGDGVQRWEVVPAGLAKDGENYSYFVNRTRPKRKDES